MGGGGGVWGVSAGMPTYHKLHINKLLRLELGVWGASDDHLALSIVRQLRIVLVLALDDADMCRGLRHDVLDACTSAANDGADKAIGAVHDGALRLHKWRRSKRAPAHTHAANSLGLQ